MFRMACLALTCVCFASYADAGEKKAKYPFAIPPLEIYERVGELGKSTPFLEDERKFLEEMWEERSKEDRVALKVDERLLRGFLYASGIDDLKKQDDYIKQFEELVKDAEEEVGKVEKPREKADRLLGFLHRKVLAKGYDSNETTLSAVFYKHKYNCVSSSAIYYLVGSRLGLDLKVILIPGDWLAGHAAVDLVDGGERIQIEPTNKEGYDWPAKKKRPGVISLGIEPDRSKAYDSEIGGLAASMASNLGIRKGKTEKRKRIRNRPRKNPTNRKRSSIPSRVAWRVFAGM